MRSSVFLAAMTTAAVLLTVQPATARADLAVRQSFNIPAQSLSSALIAFSKQADVQVVGNSNAVATHTTKGISGEYTGREALRMLLKNNPLVFEEVTTRSVRILPADGEGKGPDGRAGAMDVLSSAGFRLAMASARTADEEDENSANSAEADEKETATLTVLGSRIRRTDMEGPSPVSVYDREYIRATGALTLADFLNSLPQN